MPKNKKVREYGGNWSAIAKQARRLTWNRCTLEPLFHKAEAVHHATYRDFWGRPIKGKEKAGRHVFPLCAKCHGLAHRATNYLEFPDKRLNRNKIGFLFKLRVHFAILRSWKIFALVSFISFSIICYTFAMVLMTVQDELQQRIEVQRRD